MNTVNIHQQVDERQKAIGVFDSGVGGLTVVKELHRLLPQEDIIYLGDTARVPYGTKSRDTIINFSIQNLLYLLRHDIKCAVIACNTSSAIALPVIQGYFRLPLCGVVEAGVTAALHALGESSKTIAVLGTQATITSGAYANAIHTLRPDIETIGIACPLFVPLVEEGLVHGPVPEAITRMYLSSLIDGERQADIVILGCTHYPLLKGLFSSVLGESVTLVDSALATAVQVEAMLQKMNIKRQASSPGQIRIFVTDDSPQFIEVARRVMEQDLVQVTKVYV